MNKQDLINLMKKPAIGYETVFNVQNKAWQRFGDLCEENISINDNWPDGSIDAAQKTGLITIQFSDLFEKNLVKVLDAHLNEYGYRVERRANSVGDLVITHIDSGEEYPFELKTTQGTCFQGATHSDSKCNDYILIQYNLDYDKKFNNDGNSNLFTDFSYQVYPDMNNNWFKGKRTKRNSRTTLRVPISKHKKWSDSFVVGEAVAKKRNKDGSFSLKIMRCMGKMEKLK